jgi:hypothetical protein
MKMNMHKPACAVFVMIFAFVSVNVPGRIQAAGAVQQPATGSIGSICVLAFEDMNRNGVRDPGEGPIKDVNVDLMINQNLIIANYVTDGTETLPHCFPNLAPQQYTVSFSSPFYDPTGSATFTFALAPDEQTAREFGAVAKATAPAPDVTALQTGLGIRQRVTLSALGSAMIMIGMAGLGMIIAFFLSRRR